MENSERLNHLLRCAKQGRHAGSSGNEKNARTIVNALLDGVIGLDDDAIAGIGELAKLISDRRSEITNVIRAEIGPNPEDVHFLELRDEESGLRHYLEGRPLHAGDLVSVFTKHGWENARYEWNYNEESRPLAILDEENAIRIEESTPCRQPVV